MGAEQAAALRHGAGGGWPGVRPPGLGGLRLPFSGACGPRPASGLPLPQWPGPDLTPSAGRPQAHTWAALPGSPRLFLCLVTGLLHCIVSRGDKRQASPVCPVKSIIMIAFKPITYSFPVKNVLERPFCIANQKAHPQEQ